MQKAKEYSFLLLKYRLRSEKEIYVRLKQKKFPEEIIKEALSFLKAKKFLDDELFARAWADSRLKRSLGLRKIKEELRQKGISKETIEFCLARLKQGYCEEGIVEELARQRFEKLKGIEPKKAKSRVYAYLLRRGFSPETIIDTVNQL
ncbi:MAG: recombination regulator RecX [Candidatus Omnitrophica bacterium]|nr:recombination regulator RecX [Candidatus Omnitrophota bacterium]